MLHIYDVKPVFTGIITTGDKFEEDMMEGSIIVARKGDMKLWQKVLKVGSSVREVKEGDMVMINPKRFEVKKYDKNSLQNDLDNNPILSYQFNWVTIEDKKGNVQECLKMDVSDIDYVFEGEEKNDKIIIPNKLGIVS